MVDMLSAGRNHVYEYIMDAYIKTHHNKVTNKSHLVEVTGVEPATYGVQGRRSPN
jgi:hypothetical protein